MNRFKTRTTQWVDAGIPRRLEHSVNQVGRVAIVKLSTDPDLLPLGKSLLIGMVDDLPSEALVLRIDS